MGESNVHLPSTGDRAKMERFVRSLLDDVRALEYMIQHDWFETDVTRIGAEQEVCLINSQYKPSYSAMKILKDFAPEWLTTELAQFNLEINLEPRRFSGTAFSDMEAELRQHLEALQTAATPHGAQILLTGILPSLRKFDLNLDKLTPKPRYRALMQALRDLRGSHYELQIEGIDELRIQHDSPLLEACNTSFQVHLQVTPDEFVDMYNIAQAIAGPTLAMAANSPLLFGRRLWHETRIALFQQSIDNRKNLDHLRDFSPRVTFGRDWLQDSILNIYKEDIMRFRVLLGADIEENALELVRQGKVPKLRALQVHNGTVYRWNRPCFGISENGKPHLRIENRVLGAGPTVIDEVANTAFWLGLMKGVRHTFGDITQKMSFDDARDNFFKGARTGIDTKFTWMDNHKVAARDLVLEELLPLARIGLAQQQVASADIDTYLGIIEERAKRHMNGARWIMRSFTKFAKETNRDEALTTLTAAILQKQNQSLPAHEWAMPELHELAVYDPSCLLIEEVMQTDIFTVRKEDVLELAADVMDWRGLRYIPVEDEVGKLVGLISSRLLLRHFTRRSHLDEKPAELVEDIMVKNPITITPEATLLEATKLMKTHKIGVLPVIRNGELVGLVPEEIFVNLSRRLLHRMHAQQKPQNPS